MERMEEKIEDIEYHQYQHFISNSVWSHEAVIEQVSQEVSQVMQAEQKKTGQPTGLIIDESAHLKSGKHSVGVARQYAGVAGKVDNCQVGVYASLVNGQRASFVGERLFLPTEWVEDRERCDKAAIPEQARQYKTKPELALELIDESLEAKVGFDWVGGDSLYGHSYEFGRGLDQRGLFFVLDVHKDQRVYLEQPRIYLPQRQGNRGRKPSRLKADGHRIRVDAYAKQLDKKEWQQVRIRKTAKGWLKAWMHIKEVWVWDGQETKPRKRTLIIRKSIARDGEKTKLKYSLSNGQAHQYSTQEFAFFQAQRYWVERNFDDAKSELGMSDYQVRKWLGWHHHHAIMFMATLFMLKERIQKEEEFPLMSLRDARIMVTTLIAETMLENEPEMQRQIRLMKQRHRKRKSDIDRHFARDG